MDFSVISNADDRADNFEKVNSALAERFKKVQAYNPSGCMDSFEQSFWTHCEAVARKLNCRLTVGKDDNPLFDFVSRNLSPVSPFSAGIGMNN